MQYFNENNILAIVNAVKFSMFEADNSLTFAVENAAYLASKNVGDQVSTTTQLDKVLFWNCWKVVTNFRRTSCNDLKSVSWEYNNDKNFFLFFAITSTKLA